MSIGEGYIFNPSQAETSNLMISAKARWRTLDLASYPKANQYLGCPGPGIRHWDKRAAVPQFLNTAKLALCWIHSTSLEPLPMASLAAPTRVGAARTARNPCHVASFLSAGPG